jgi:hypothetical protein
MELHTFTLDADKRRKVQLVAGLEWQPLVPDSFKKRLVPLAGQYRADLYVYRRSDKAMVGFASSDLGAKAGQIPLALLVTESLGSSGRLTNALIALRLSEDKYSYIMVRDGFVLAGYDIIGTEEKIKDQFLSDFSSSDDWETLICPDAWKVRNAVQREVETFFPPKGKLPRTWELRQIKPSRGKFVAKLVIFGLVVYLPYWGYEVWQKARQEAAVAALIASQNAVAQAQRQERISAEPWHGIARAADFVAACQQAFDQVEPIVAGWVFNGFACEGGALTVQWTRGQGYALASYLKERVPTAMISPDGNSAFASYPLQVKVDLSAPKEELPSATARVMQMTDYGPSIGIPVAVKPGPIGPKVVEGAVLPWTDFQFSLSTAIKPLSAVDAISAPGMRISRVSGSIAGSTFKYQLQGTQYAKP